MPTDLWMKILRAPEGEAPSGPSVTAPAAAPAPAPAPDAGAEAPVLDGLGKETSAEVDWGEFTDLDPPKDPAAKGGLAGPSPAPAGAQPPAAGPSTTEGQPAAVAPPAFAPVQVAPPEVQAPPAEGIAPTFDPHDPAWQAERISALAPYFQLSEEQALQMQTEPGVVLPQLAANLFFRTQLEIAQFMSRWASEVLPQMLDQRDQGREKAQTAKQAVQEQVFKAYPKLAEVPVEALGSFTKHIAATMRDKPPTERIAALGRAVYAMNGWPLPNARPTGAANPPQANPAAAGAMPFMPMAPGAAPPPAAMPNGRDATNPWETLLEP